MNRKKVLIALVAILGLYQLAAMTQSALKVPQKPLTSGASVGRGQAYQEILDQKDYRVFKNSGASEHGVEVPYETASDTVGEAVSGLEGQSSGT